MSTSLKRRIQSLERQGGSARDVQIKKQQVGAASHRFPRWRHFLTSVVRYRSSKDRIGQVEIRRCHSKLPTSGTAIQAEIQAEDGTPVQNRCDSFQYTFCICTSQTRIVFPVKPDASPEEVRAVVDDSQGGQIFSQAVRLILFICKLTLNL